MKNISNYLLVTACVLAFSCKKEIARNTAASSSENASLLSTEEGRWQGVFISSNGLPPSRFVADSLFIKNGYARIYRNSATIDEHNYYGTLIRVLIPSSINIRGDSINFEAGMKNPLNSAFYSPEHGRDITMYIRGATNHGLVTNVATSDVDPDGLPRAGIRIGQTVKNNLPQLQHNFEDYDTLILQTFNRGIVAYRNNALVTGLAYEHEPNIGRLEEVGIIFKGSGYINYVKIFNSVTGKLLMVENFNTDGESTIVWH